MLAHGGKSLIFSCDFSACSAWQDEIERKREQIPVRISLTSEHKGKIRDPANQRPMKKGKVKTSRNGPVTPLIFLLLFRFFFAGEERRKLRNLFFFCEEKSPSSSCIMKPTWGDHKDDERYRFCPFLLLLFCRRSSKKDENIFPL